MSDTRHILEDEALDYVLKEHRPAASVHQESDDLVATIRGDLEQVSLPDIFQTLTMSAMRGTLRISQGWDPTYVHFADNQVRVLAPEELQARRLGNRLVTSGLLDAKGVRAAFVRARKEQVPLATILEATGKIEKVQYDAIRLALEEDFLLELFTLKRGAFAFFKENYPIPGLEERFEQCMPFETEQVLLEIARRADEWGQILETIGDLDELFVRTGMSFPEADDLRGDLYELIDGKRTLRDIAGGMLDALFDVAKAAKWLVDNECIELARAGHLLKLAREAIDEQHLRRALFCLRLTKESRRTRPDQLEEVASLFVQAGDPRAAADVMLRIVQKIPDPERQYELIVQARSLDGLNVDILECLVQMMRATAVPGEIEFDDAVESLCELYIDAERYEDALALCEELEFAHPADLSLASRKARILHALDRGDEGIAHLERLKEVYRYQKNTEDCAKTLEQILRIDPRNSRARVELRALQESKGVRRLKRFSLVLVVALIGRVAWGFWSGWRDGERALADLGTATSLLEEGKVMEAKKLAEEIASRDLDDEVMQRAVLIIESAQSRFEESTAKRSAELVAKMQERIGKAVAELEGGRWVASLESYKSIAKDFSGVSDAKKRLQASLRTRFKTLTQDLQSELARFQEQESSSRIATESAADRLKLQEKWKDWFEPTTLKAARELVAAHGAKKVETILPIPKELVTLLSKYVEVGAAHRKRYDALAIEIEKDMRTKALNHAFVAARKCEEKYDFAGAAKLYDELVHAYEGSEETAEIFRAKLELYQEIEAGVRELASATKAGDHERAIATLRMLRTQWPAIPFDELVSLPMHIDSSPRGARVFDGKREIGKTPVLIEYAPGRELDLRLELDGFHAVEAPDDASDVGRYSTVLEAKPTATARFAGSTTRPGVLVAGRYIASDRQATLKAFDPTTGRQAWSRSVEENSGDLGAMLPLLSRVVIASPSGVVRSISPIDGSDAWSVDLGTRITSPAIDLGGELLILDRLGNAHILDTATGDKSETIALGNAVSFPPVRVGADRFAVLDSSATLHLYDKQGREIWQQGIAGAGWVAPVCVDDMILVIGGKSLEARSVDDGSLRWRSPLRTTPRLAITVQDDTIALIVGNRELTLLDRRGKIVASRKLLGRPSAAPRLLGSSVLVPLEKGGTVVHDLKDLALVSLLSSATTSEISPIALGKKSVLVSATNGTLHFFDPAVLSKR